MAATKGSQLDPIAGADTAAGDLFFVVDVSDTTQGATGTTKNLTRAEAVAAMKAQDSRIGSFSSTHETKLGYITITMALDLDAVAPQAANGQTAFDWGDHALAGYSTFDPASPGTIGGTTPGVVNATKVAIAAGTHTVSTDRVQSDTVTWNGSGQTMVAKRTNVTDTASATGSIIEDWQVGGATKAQITKGGRILASGGSASLPGIGFHDLGGASGMYMLSTNVLAFSGGTQIFAGSDPNWGRRLRVGAIGWGWSGSAANPASNTAVAAHIIDSSTIEFNNGNTGTRRDVKLRNLIATGRIDLPQYTTATRPASVNGSMIFDTDLDKALIGGAAGWEVVTSV